MRSSSNWQSRYAAGNSGSSISNTYNGYSKINTPHKPWAYWAESAEQNLAPIATTLQPFLSRASRVLEIGSGTGQHAVSLCAQNAHLRWQPSEHPAGMQMLNTNLGTHGSKNIEKPLALDASSEQWPEIETDLIYSANTLHIMSWKSVCQLFSHFSRLLDTGENALIYGPFRFSDRPFAPSNDSFDQFLRLRDPHSGIRDVSALEQQGETLGLRLWKDFEMPENNHILVWQRT